MTNMDKLIRIVFGYVYPFGCFLKHTSPQWGFVLASSRPGKAIETLVFGHAH